MNEKSIALASILIVSCSIGSASASQLFLTCNTQEEIKTVTAEGAIVQDDWSNLRHEIEINGPNYQLTTILPNGPEANVVGTVLATATKFILQPSNIRNQSNSIIKSESYINRVTGDYTSITLLGNDSTRTITSISTQGPCIVAQKPKTKF